MEKEWTIIFLIYADFRKDGINHLDTDLKREFDSLMTDLKTCYLHEKMEILIIRNIVNPEASSKVEFDFTEVLRVTKRLGHDNKFESLERTPTLRLVQKAQDIGELFNKVHCNKFDKVITKAKRYFLITWDHGSAFGIFRRNITIQDKIEERTKEIMLNFSDGKNDINVKKQLVFQKEIFPVSLQKTNDDNYQKVLRHWESPIYRYFTKENVFLFSLNSQNVSEQFYHKMISDPSFNVDTKIIQRDKKISLEITNIHLYNINIGVSNEILIKKLNNPEEKIFPLSEDDNDNLDEKILKPNVLEHLEIETNQLNGNIVRIDLPVEQNKILDILTNEELQSAITKGFKSSLSSEENKNIDVLLMMNCYMMNIHTCYALRDSVNYLIAPQGGISEPGYNYNFILSEIFESLVSEMIESQTLAELCVYSSGYELSAKRRKFKNEINQWVIMALCLKEYETIANTIDRIGNSAIEIFRKNNGKDPLFIFSDVRNRCIRFDDLSLTYFMIDITHWLSELIILLNKVQINTDSLVNEYFTLINFIDTKIKALRIGPDLYSPESFQLIQKKPYGTTIYFPQEIYKDEEFNFFIDKNSHNQSQLLKEKINWLKFLNKDFSQ